MKAAPATTPESTMFALIIKALNSNPQGLTPTRIAQELGMRHHAQLNAVLRDMHWRKYVARNRTSSPGEVVYSLLPRDARITVNELLATALADREQS